MHVSIPPRPPEADHDDIYPHSDGRPVGETPAHFRNLSHVKEILDAHFAGDPCVFVAANMFLYYLPGDRLKHVSPDLFVAHGVAQRDLARAETARLERELAELRRQLRGKDHSGQAAE